MVTSSTRKSSSSALKRAARTIGTGVSVRTPSGQGQSVSQEIARKKSTENRTGGGGGNADLFTNLPSNSNNELTKAIESPKQANIKVTDNSISGQLSTRLEMANQGIGRDFVDPVTGRISRGISSINQRTGRNFPTTIQEARESSQRTTKLLEERGVPRGITQTGSFISGIGLGITEDITQRPATEGLLFAGGVAVGGIGTGIAVGAARAGPRVAKAAKIGETVIGTGFLGIEALNTGKKISKAKDSQEAGSIFGKSVKDVGVFGSGAVTGQRTGTRLRGIFRTRGLKEIPSEKVIAPEFFKGQTFPQIRKGQTAGELRSEFFDTVLPGETSGVSRGFTARSFDLPNTIPPSKGKPGELIGLFQAPRVSPQFLRIGGRNTKLFGLNTQPSSKPSIIRLETKGIELAPGVRSGQKRPAPLKVDAQKFSESIRGTGRSVIPFVKTEKEAVVAIGTPVLQTNTRFFTRFEGVRVPIQEFKVNPINEKPSIGISQANIQRAVKASSSGRISAPSLITPSSSSLSSSFSRALKGSSSSSRSSLSPSLPKITSSSTSNNKKDSKPVPSVSFESLPPSIKSDIVATSSSILKPLSKKNKSKPVIPKSQSKKSSIFNDIRRTSKKSRNKKPLLKAPNQRLRISPSVTASILKIKSPAISLGGSGVNPFKIRGLQTGKKKKKKKK